MKLRPLPRLVIATSLAAIALVYPLHILAQESDSWMKDWAVQSGFALDVAVEGLNLPTSIAFVPEPGSDPKDPAFFVAELQGAVKVVTNDGSILTFADGFFNRDPAAQLPGEFVETGLAGICLAPEQGYVFVTYAYVHEDGSIRNSVGRFDTTPQSFSVRPESFQEFRWIFLSDESSPSHQVGSCQVHEDHLFVGVGDGQQPGKSVDLESSLGKVLRMTFDGLPSLDNPHFSDGAKSNPTNYIWARGFRNPFGLRSARGRLFVADNGNSVDRFLEIEIDGNYLWTGSESSFMAVSDLLIPVSRGLGQFDFYHSGLGFFPDEFNNRFFLVQSGSPNEDERPMILTFEYGFSERRLLSIPGTVLEHRGQRRQVIVSATFGPDGLYIVPLFPSEDGVNRILRMTYDPLNAHPFPMSRTDQPMEIMRNNGCLACHSFGEANVSATAPALDPNQLITRLSSRLNSSEYEATLKAVDELIREPFASYRDARAQLLQLEGMDRVRFWLEQRLREPRFDDPGARMPQPNLAEEEILILTDFLLTAEETNQTAEETNLTDPEPIDDRAVSLADRVRALLPNPMGIRHLASFLIAGVVIGWLSLSALLIATRFRRRADRSNGNRANGQNW
ncbi:MAG: PQQ-dependent sugar dehydrogenase [Chloroflexi bacterium]|nr:PQQ-dependent sugar dehydrogenase [Chloroflexota bacterium]